MAYNLSRNSRVFFTTNLDVDKKVITNGSTPFSVTNCFEVQVLDGFKFSQNTNQSTITINEAGTTPIRGQRAFNTALNPVDISFSTYMRPRLSTGQATAEERVLWNALLGSVAIDGTAGIASVAVTGTITNITRTGVTSSAATITGTTLAISGVVQGDIVNLKGITGTNCLSWMGPVKIGPMAAGAIQIEYLTAPPSAAGTVHSTATGLKVDKAAWIEHPSVTGNTVSAGIITSATSNKNQLQAFGMIFVVDTTWYVIDNCAMDSAGLDFGLDAIAMVNWTAKGTALRTIVPSVTGVNMAAANPIFATSGNMTGTATGKVTTANYITNKLSTTTLVSNIGGLSGTAYTVVLTGGNMTISNNITYVTPNNIGVVNNPIGYFTGARAVSGSVNAYLRTGTGYAADLLSTMLTNIATLSETKYKLQLEIGGAGAGTRVEVEMPGVVLGIPSVDIADVVSTAITFNAQGTSSDQSLNTYDLENTNDVTLRYYSAS